MEVLRDLRSDCRVAPNSARGLRLWDLKVAHRLSRHRTPMSSRCPPLCRERKRRVSVGFAQGKLHARPARAASALVVTLLFAVSCAGASASPSQLPSPQMGTATRPVITPLVETTWPVRTREHLDLWLHSYALLTPDTTLVPYFRRGYRERINTIRRQRNVSSLLDGNRAKLLERIAVQPGLATGGQFLPLYFSSWDQMRQVIDLFIRNNGNPGASNDPSMRTYFALLGAAFQNAGDREWLRLLTESVDDESRRFYHDYWTNELRSHAAVVAHTDSLWQRQWRPALQRFLNNTQQQNGELYLSLPLGGEGRTVHFGKAENAVAGPMPESNSESEFVLYVMVHEISGAVASTAITDNTTPADQRAGLTSRYEQAAAVRAGAILLEHTIPSAVPGYMRYYLQTTGRTPPTDPKAMFASTFAIPDAIRDAIARQFDVILGGI
jgi:hypothetical protein